MKFDKNVNGFKIDPLNKMYYYFLLLHWLIKKTAVGEIEYLKSFPLIKNYACRSQFEGHGKVSPINIVLDKKNTLLP